MFLSTDELRVFSRLPRESADQRIFYDAHPLKFGDLRLPRCVTSSDHALVVLIHGGQWESSFDHGYMSCLAEALTDAGIATWNIEYRRINNPGGGYPGTFLDVAQGIDFVRQLAGDYPIDLDRVVLMGHSSGGHLATWAAGRAHVPSASALASERPLEVAGVIDLAGVLDLEYAYKSGRDDILNLLDASDETELCSKVLEASSINLLPMGIPQTLIIGTEDSPWRIRSHERYLERSAASGDDVKLVRLNGVNHFDIVDAEGAAWDPIIDTVHEYTGRSHPAPNTRDESSWGGGILDAST